ncbi:MAG TPA: PAS domain S-box protein [Thermoanaerobaculia bacterium]|nr:PAS domain S-box protein [Thermoanaerobaculia bacterium]
MTPTAALPALFAVDPSASNAVVHQIIDALFDLQDGIALVSRDGEIREANDAFRTMGADDSLQTLEPWLDDLWSGRLRRVDVDVQIPMSGRERWSRVQAVLADCGDEPHAVVVIAPLHARAGSNDSEIIAQFLQMTTNWVWQCDRGARYTFASARIRDFLGYDRRELIGKTACDFMAPADAERAAAVLRDVLRTPRPFSHIELLCQHRDGHIVALDVSGVPVIDADGSFHGYRGVVHDVTEREVQKRALQRLAMAIDHAGDMVVITDREARVEYANPAFEWMTGYCAEDVIGEYPSLWRGGERPAEVSDDICMELRAGHPWSGHLVNKRLDGTLFHTDSTISPIFDAGGEITGYVGVHRDVTETMTLLGRLRGAAEMERFGRLVSGVAHEVRNPLNAIQAATATMELDCTDPETKPLFEIVRSQVQRLAQLMRDLLIIAKPVHENWLQPLRIGEVVVDALASWQRDPNIHVSLAVDFDGDVWLDSGRMHQVIVNLLDNAVQHSGPNPEISIAVRYDGAVCRIAVRDAGRGVSAGDLAHVFEPFFTTRHGGTGLGLSLVKSIVEQHGGSVTLRPNDPEPGCTAEVVLPVVK